MERLNFQEQFEAIQSIETLSPEIALGTKVVEILTEANEEAYFAGGFGRDLFMGKTPKDVDVATSAEFDQVLEILQGANLENVKIQGVQTAGAYPVVLAYSGDFNIEIASYRKDIYEEETGEKSDKKRRKAKTETGVSLLEDVKRRDLTINTLMFDPLTAQIIDPLTASEGVGPQSGIADLENKLIRFVGDPKERILEDRIRILRAIRFKNRYEGFSYAPETETALYELAPEVEKISGERIREEINKIFSGPNRAQAVKELDQFGILKIILPELIACQIVDQSESGAHENPWQHLLSIADNLPNKPSENLIWSVLLSQLDYAKMTESVIEKDRQIKFPRPEPHKIRLARFILDERFHYSKDRICEVLWLLENQPVIHNFAQMSLSEQKKLSLPHKVDGRIKNPKLAIDLLEYLWAENQGRSTDGSVDESSFNQVKQMIETIIEQSDKTPFNIKEGLDIDGELLISYLKIPRNKLQYLSKLTDYLDDNYRDNVKLNRDQILEMAGKWWQENVLVK